MTPNDHQAEGDGVSAAAEPSEVEQVTAWLEKLTRDPMVDAVAGHVRVVSVSEPSGRARYQECEVELAVEAPGIPSAIVRQTLVFPRAVWPRVGDVVPARISRSRPEMLEAVWDRLSRR